jgi:8-oxo-dGTP pyrophosphatase MutT (NUDIX family)
MTQEPERIVYVFVILEDGKIALLQRALTRKTEPGNYGATAAGHIEGKESPSDAGVRELEEETGIKVSKRELYRGYLGTMPVHAYSRGNTKARPLEAYVFLVNHIGTSATQIKLSPEHIAILTVGEERLSLLIEAMRAERKTFGHSRLLRDNVRQGGHHSPPLQDIPLTNPTKEILLSPIGKRISEAVHELHEKVAKSHQRSTS